ncbi:fibronectin type III domain-containing protein [Anaeromyxobacter diazotrophicus]|uniref:Fibronectin type-III domain-containing protein n=1 Tax=Anaeromyxobacter diazotrophicus TaxID=2590199 RepID=A0A7I9VH99_9BACT|nr:fibronectin type III domain-containing protein [Anaeromyxobacter diazotrophicus]GEJ55510.1 hypothetical protein AMYX_02510 [Anaeromyxobacter diazotrophicus]
MTRRLSVLACLACAPALAAAQVVVSESTGSGTVYINSGECNNAPADTLSLQWSVTTTAASYDLYVSDTAGCPIPSTNTNTNAHTNSFVTGVASSSYTGITAATLLSKVPIQCTSTTNSVAYICVFAAGTNANSGSPLATGSVQLDLASPAKPNLLSLTPGDGSLNANWDLGTGSAAAGTIGSANSFRVHYAPADGSAAQQYREFTGASTRSGRVTGLTNNVPYTVTVTALTIGGNESLPSDPITGSPIPVDDFWRLYQNAGGREQGGCASGAAGLAALVALAPLVLRRKRRRP